MVGKQRLYTNVFVVAWGMARGVARGAARGVARVLAVQSPLKERRSRGAGATTRAISVSFEQVLHLLIVTPEQV